jgi:hypothetical protein
VVTSWTIAVGFVLSTAFTSARLWSPRISLCPVRKAAQRVAASGVDRMRYSLRYGKPLSK